ncbi:Geranylgeranylglycerol-phosphategeranylgeranyltr ansferase [Pyrolobus fumarii 1A]|uniref:Geranylgeranylglycerol-phosphategeranylgeranyltr ansferase n=1 Tax=Pyrolobus fumarii (strain DSM 11204 / 1A) TaxID=694429 RepID=G0EE97_PYRF1|nr:geranylgeranylglycerol-phosphate geranylgeranyltransferase [Pyrolobus fumarii]AEM38791.1 Geranylgeranylglycerol-phosphategeranylgeranyltr ansferase [Pyrolobus fumarii 1A]
MKLLHKLSGYVELVRPHNVLVAVLNGIVGFVTVAWLTGCLDNACLYPALAAIALVAAGGYVVNDYFDADIDAISKPSRPIPSGRVTPGEAHLFALALLALGVYAGFSLSILHGLYALIVAMLLYAYPAWMKRRRALTGHLTVAATGASTIIYGGLAAGVCCNSLDASLLASSIPAAYAFTLILAREFVKALEDFEGDSARGAATIATRYGIRTARSAAIALLLCVAVAAPLPALIGPYGAVYLALASMVILLNVYSIRLLVRGEYPKARRALKIAFGFGGLAFLAEPVLALILR